MDPKVCGKLLTHHRRGYGVDVEALHDRFPLQRIIEKAPRWDLTGTEGCGGGKVVLWLPLMFLGYKSIYRRKKCMSVELQGAHEGGGRAYPPGRALLPCGRLISFLASTPSLLDCVCSKNDPCEGFIPSGFHLIFLFCETVK